MQKVQLPSGLHVTRCGQGQDLVLLHGWGVNSGVWAPIIAPLQARFRLHLIDLPGFGDNVNILPADYQLDSLAAMLEDAVPDNAWLMGWSMGGLIANQLALRGKVKLARLLLLATSPKFTAQPPWHGIQPAILEMFAAQLTADVGKTLHRFLAIQAMGSESARQDVKIISAAVQSRPVPTKQTLQKGLDLLETCDLRNAVSALCLPVELIFGRLDTLVPHKAMDDIAACYPGARLKLFPHASHAPFISHSEEFCDWLLECQAQ
ncbi:pimeloyl-ACP methyl ester esterase BioH [Bowmanella sp. JS7-9]|uniref:Pimeloyl-[acyl-carrier protein] methyl ester esterase n=1 Tax=Pseudobowmanella zhangzhouensis TaxID=1537679 RepID=A0ABW1XEE0_9ALTE|nr:pimeloyl-ACP methyl ester esterase BioH [Bowmanella sp. JS7-9]TBX20923.1 hypothetical protein TK45_14270 [Bowmanella sp. JS7-9]